MKLFVADIILLIHIKIAIFIIAVFFLVPYGYKVGWKWVRKRQIRFIHFILILVVTLESLLGVVCPLTIIENSLRIGKYENQSFIRALSHNLFN